MIIRCFEDANDHTMHKCSLSIILFYSLSIYNIILICCAFLPADLFELQVKNACFESHKFYE